MARPTPDKSVFGLLNVDKPSGPTSHDVVSIVRRGIGEKRVGHAGTLDPLASGVLVLALGKATRLLEYLTRSSKRYRATLRLGLITDTHDTQGHAVAERPLPADLSLDAIQHILDDQFSGEILQTPPVYSAIKVGGKPAYARARAGETPELEPRPVVIYAIEAVSLEPPHLALDVHCGAGTYVRSIARDLGATLGCGATLSGLTRVASGSFHLDDAAPLDALRTAFDDGTWQAWLLPADFALDDTLQVNLDAADLEAIRNGRAISAHDARGIARAYAPGGSFVAVLEGDGNLWRPRKVFV